MLSSTTVITKNLKIQQVCWREIWKQIKCKINLFCGLHWNWVLCRCRQNVIENLAQVTSYTWKQMNNGLHISSCVVMNICHWGSVFFFFFFLVLFSITAFYIFRTTNLCRSTFSVKRHVNRLQNNKHIIMIKYSEERKSNFSSSLRPCRYYCGWRFTRGLGTFFFCEKSSWKEKNAQPTISLIKSNRYAFS